MCNHPLKVVNRVRGPEWRRGVVGIVVPLGAANNMLGGNSKRQPRSDCNNQLPV